jgi:hypothetical protein
MKTPNLTAIALALTLVIPLLVSGCGKTVGQTIDDATITTRVKTALLNDPDVGGMRGGLRIDVDTFKGVVTLSGAVRSAEERDKAIAIARKIYGVTDVKSTLQIEGIKSPSYHSSSVISFRGMPSACSMTGTSLTSELGPQTKHRVSG